MAQGHLVKPFSLKKCIVILLWINLCSLTIAEDALSSTLADDVVTSSHDSISTLSYLDKLDSEEDLEEESYGCPPDVNIPCVPKCCNITQGYALNKTCVEHVGVFEPDFSDCQNYAEFAQTIPLESRYEYFLGDPCTDGKYMLQPEEYPEEEYTLFSNGSLYMGGRLLSLSEYCLETYKNTTQVFVCFTDVSKETERKFEFILYPVGLLISVPFLITTGLLYVCNAQLRDTQGKALSCHVFCLALAYLFLAIVQLTSNSMNEDLCIAAGFAIQFFFIACFFWLNVMCFDIWRNVQTVTYNSVAAKSYGNDSERKRFVLYSMYAWYGPSLFLIITLIMDLEPGIPESLLKPHFGGNSCWFHDKTAALPYFYGPVGLLVMVNIVFFVLSVRKIWRYEKEERFASKAALLKRSLSEEEKKKIKSIRLNLCKKTLKQSIQLFCVMGINWVAEILSWALGGPIYIWVITDVFNTLQGLLIFFIFVVREKKAKFTLKENMERISSKCLSICKRSQAEDRSDDSEI